MYSSFAGAVNKVDKYENNTAPENVHGGAGPYFPSERRELVSGI